MTVPTNQPQENKVPENKPNEAKPNDKEYNFRQLEARYQRELEKERAARIEAEKLAREHTERQKRVVDEEDDIDDEPYVNNKKLNKTLQKFGQQQTQQTQTEIQKAVHMALQEERKQNWMKNNPDFYDIMQHAEKLMIKDPELAETILEMPEGFERQKLVYKNIKALGLHQPEEKKASIQEKVDANRKGPYYQPSGVSSSPYSMQGDFSSSGQKNAYQKMQDLKKRLGQ